MAAATTPVTEAADVGAAVLLVVPVPICPFALYPQHHNAPLLSIVHVLYPPQATFDTPHTPDTVIGALLSTVLPLPT